MEDSLKRYDFSHGILRKDGIQQLSKKQESNKLLEEKMEEYDFLHGRKIPRIESNQNALESKI